MEGILGRFDSSTESAAATNVSFALARRSGTAKAAETANNNSNPAPATGSSSNITASDFLTLLVSEMKNQDPTQPTDPNAYLQQLVGVNSLQQLIQINQGLTALETGNSGGSGTQST